MSDTWSFDDQFFNDLNEWEKDHPDASLKTVWDHVVHIIDSAQNFLEVIPNPAGLPFRGIVRGLGQIIKLAAIIKTSDGKLRQFTIEVVKFISFVGDQVREAGSKDKGFSDQTLNDLTAMKELLVTIFKWIEDGIGDGHGRFCLVHTFKKTEIPDEIKEFKSQIQNAHIVFQSRTLIRMSTNMRSLIRMNKETNANLKQMENTLKAALKSMKIAYEQQSKMVAEGIVREGNLQRILHPNTVASPTYTVALKAPCSDDSRVEVLKDIRAWIKDFPTSSKTNITAKPLNFLWLTGDPGCGKSAITATIAKECMDNNVLWAQFFISRAKVDTTKPRVYFPSIARQFAEHSNVLQKYIHDKLMARQTAINTPKEASLFFIDAVQQASSVDPTKAVVIVIDGLDETDENDLSHIAIIFSELFKELPQCPNVKMLISSRTEQSIQKPFTDTMDGHVKHIHLDTASSYRDVAAFMEKELKTILYKHGLDFETSVGMEDMKKLADRASGLFIWAVTALDLIDGYISNRQEDMLTADGRLAILHPLTHTEQMTQINQLYGLVLEFAYSLKFKADESDFEVFRRLMGAIVVAQEPLNVQQLQELLAVRRTPTGPLVNVGAFVQRFRTVLVPGLSDINEHTTPKIHKSFFEYITGRGTKEHFRVDENTAHAEMALQCLTHLAGAYAAVESTQFASARSDVKSLSASFLYAQHFCASHLQRDGLAMKVVLDNSIEFPQFLSLLGQSLDTNSKGPLATILYPLQKNSQHISTSLNDQHLVWDSKGSSMEPLMLPVKHLETIQSIDLAPDGSKVVSASQDGSIALWSTESLKAVETTLSMGHLEPVKCVAYSKFLENTANMLVSSGDDGDLHIWNTTTGSEELVIHRSTDSPESVYSLAFSHGFIALGSSNGSVEIWDVKDGISGPPTSPIRQFHHSFESTKAVTSVNICSDVEWILSASANGTLALWSISQDTQVGGFLTGHSTAILSAAISSDRNYFVSGSGDQTVRLWSSQNQTEVQLGQEVLVTHDDPVYSVEFSPCGQYIASASAYQVILTRIDIPNTQTYTVATFETILGAPPCPLVFSSNGQQLLFSSGDYLKIVNAAPFLHNTQSISVLWTVFSPSGNLIVSYNQKSAADRGGWLSLFQLNSDLEVIRPTLDCKNAVIALVAFSSDETLIVGASTTGLILFWEVSSSKLLGFSTETIHDISSIYFKAKDDTTIVAEVTSGQKKIITLPPINNTLIITTTSDTLTPPLTQFPLSPATNPHIYGTGTASNHRLRDIKWFPSSGPQDGTFWACIDNCLIRGSKDGRYVIVPLTMLQAL
ncbi:hypothetical protein H0H87_003328 [Tephrocybe sp. NHM501043]|nr:hypothetical protein H0H87_003328 [Tephrocybe sp. NHM501043]